MLMMLLDHLLLMIFAPLKGWKRIVRERMPEAVVRSNFVFPLMGVASMASFLGLVFSEGVPNALKAALITFIAFFGAYFMASYLINEIVGYFGEEKNLSKIQVFVGFSSSILYLLNIIMGLRFLPEFFFLQIFALYTIYIVWESVGVYFKRITDEARAKFTLVSSCLILISPFLIKKVLGLLMPGL